MDQWFPTEEADWLFICQTEEQSNESDASPLGVGLSVSRRPTNMLLDFEGSFAIKIDHVNTLELACYACRSLKPA